ncbi:glycosyltransferase family 4 protein, partial [bacterium]|nr:glycosyltransferase family 4 protein [bacterium]
LNAIKRFLKDADLIIPNSRFTQDEFMFLGISPEKFFIATPGVDTQRFFPTEKDPILIKKHKLKDKIVLLTVARLDERKGHDNVIRALSRLKNQYHNLVYIIIGKGREEAKLKALCQQLKVEDQVIFTGYITENDLPKYYNLCDIFILLNRQTAEYERLRGDYEGFGIVFLEASACGKPVIAGNYGGISDAIENGKSGYIIDGTNLQIITKTLDKLLQNTEIRIELGNYGLERARKTFDWKLKSREILPLI